jgi:aryl-alcohol dehydrogenase-like predicted oxidoreductase
VSEIGFGGWGIGGAYYGKVERSHAVKAVKTYIEAGGNHIDTAYSYQMSEEVIGEAIKGFDRSKLIITSKTYAGCFDLKTIPDIRRQLEISMRGLGTDYIDIYMIHGAPSGKDHMNKLCGEFEVLKKEGKIRVIGASIPGPNVNDESLNKALQYANSGSVEVLQINYSIARQKNGGVFDEAKRNGVGLITRWVLESGMLGGKYLPGHEFIWPDTRNRFRPNERDAMLELGQTLKSMLPQGYSNPVELAAAFALEDPAVSGVILGAINAEQVKRNCEMDGLPPLPKELIKKLKETYGPMNDRFNPTGEFEHVDGRLGAAVE